MCRYVAYLGAPMPLAKLLYEPANGLIHQASHAMESRKRINADGFGVAWYNPRTSAEPAVFKDISPAWNNANLRSLAGAVRSGCILAHVRAARRFDPISRSNCHPFQYGRLLWMHNGDIPGRARLHRRVVSLASDELVARISGNTDSELAFVLFLSLLEAGGDRGGSADRLASAMEQTVQQLFAWYREDDDERALALNFCVTDGESIVALRYTIHHAEIPTLHYCRGSRFVCEDGVCRIHTGEPERCVILASEELSDDPEWTSVLNGTMVVIRDADSIELRRLPL